MKLTGLTKFVLKIKEALDINWIKPNLNAQQNHLALTLSLTSAPPPPPPPPLVLFCLCCCFVVVDVVVVFAFLFHPLFPLYLTLIIGIFCCLNYTLLLLHLFITRLAIDYIINICPTQLL